jgi:hypothetical protein
LFGGLVAEGCTGKTGSLTIALLLLLLLLLSAYHLQTTLMC